MTQSELRAVVRAVVGDAHYEELRRKLPTLFCDHPCTTIVSSCVEVSASGTGCAVVNDLVHALNEPPVADALGDEELLAGVVAPVLHTRIETDEASRDSFAESAETPVTPVTPVTMPFSPEPSPEPARKRKRKHK